MAENIEKKRVWTKVDTLENWNNNPLLLGPGEMALVTTPSGIPLNMKWGDKNERKRFSDLPFAISYDQGQFVIVDGPGELTTPESDVAYSLVGQGTYTYPGQADIVAPEGRLSQLVWDGSTWSLVDMGELPVAPVDGLLEKGGYDGNAEDLNNRISDVDIYAQEVNDIANSANDLAVNSQSTANQALNTVDSAMDDIRVEMNSKVWPTANIANESITMPKLSGPVKDYIDAAGGGVINNAPDDEDLTSDDELLKFKDGAEGFARIRVVSGFTAQRNEIHDKSASFGFILIKDIIDLQNGSARGTVTIPAGTTVRFVGNGMLRNCVLVADGIKIEAGRKQIFDNVEMMYYNKDGMVFSQTFDQSAITIPSGYTKTCFNKKTGQVVANGTDVNPLDVKPMNAHIDDLTQPELSGANWVWKLNGSTEIRFQKDGSDNILLPISGQYQFFDVSTDAVLTQGQYYDPATVKVAKLTDYSMTARSQFVCDFLYPEWWGAVADGSTDNTKAFNQCILTATMQGARSGAAISLAGSNKIYNTDGGIIARDNVTIYGNKAWIRLSGNATNHLFIYDTIKRMVGFSLKNITLNGNKTNQNLPLNGIFFDWVFDQPYYSGYNWDDAVLEDVKFINFTQDGCYASTPGDVTMTGTKFMYNDRDGISWDSEHFKLYECTAWGNGRDGARAAGNHWRIIGGAYAHNTRHNINCDGAFEFQIVAPSAIDAGDSNIHLVNCYRFSVMASRSLNGNIGIYVGNTASLGTITGNMVFSNTTNLVNEGQYIKVSANYGLIDSGIEDIEVPRSGLGDYSIANGKGLYDICGGSPFNGERKAILATGVAGVPSGMTAPVSLTVHGSTLITGGVPVRQRMFIKLQDSSTESVVATRSLVYEISSQTDFTDSGWKVSGQQSVFNSINWDAPLDTIPKSDLSIDFTVGANAGNPDPSRSVLGTSQCVAIAGGFRLAIRAVSNGNLYIREYVYVNASNSYTTDTGWVRMLSAGGDYQIDLSTINWDAPLDTLGVKPQKADFYSINNPTGPVTEGSLSGDVAVFPIANGYRIAIRGLYTGISCIREMVYNNTTQTYINDTGWININNIVDE